MSVAGDPARRLRDLHEAYVWEVNAAIGEGREDLVWRLNDQYVGEALQAVSDDLPAACERPGCPVCSRPPGGPTAAVGRLGWRRRLGWRWLGWRR